MLLISFHPLAHKVAYEKAGLLHRDISPGNILITEDGDGILIDWQFAEKIGPNVNYCPPSTWRVASL